MPPAPPPSGPEPAGTGQEWLYQALAAADVGIFEVDIQRGIRHWDATTHRLVGTDPRTFDGSNAAFLEKVHPDDRERVARQLPGALVCGPYHLEFRVVRPDGSLRHLAARGTVFPDASGRPARTAGAVWDVTRGKRAEAVLRQERAFTRALLDNLAEGVMACDREGRMVTHNRTLNAWHGIGKLSRALQEGHADFALFHPGGRTPLAYRELPLVRALGGERFQGMELQHLPADGPVRLLSCSGAPILDALGRKLGAVVVASDVTAQRRRDAVLRQVMVAVEQSPVMVVITDPDGAIEYVNPMFTRVTGYQSGEVMGRNPRFLKGEGVTPGLYRQLWDTLARGEVWKGEFHNRKKSGEHYWESATIAPIRDEGGAVTHYVAVKEDVTEFRRNQQLLKELNEELEERIRQRTALLEAANAELDAFSYSVSHDLRAPLRGIDGFSLALLEEFGDSLGPDGRHYLTRVRSGVQRMGQLIDDLLKLSRFSRGDLNRAPLDLTAMARAVGEELRRGEPERDLELRVEDGLAARGDPGLVRSMLANLMGNAWKYTARVPRAVVEVVRAAPVGDEPAFCIRDNGAGFDMAYADKLFAPFHRLHSAHEFEGSGIGLALVQRIVHRHGGRVWAEGEVGGGARFYFTLPDG
jgi:PAS domain S-box-containing protein